MYREQGQEVDYIDARNSYDPKEPWHEHIRMDDNGELVIPVSEVYNVMIENEQLRQTLYYNQTSENNVFANQIINNSNITKGVVRTEVKKVASNHSVTEKDLYNYMYDIAKTMFYIELPKHTNESKLTQYWRAGALPLLFMVVRLYDVVAHNYKHAQKFAKLPENKPIKF